MISVPWWQFQADKYSARQLNPKTEPFQFHRTNPVRKYWYRLHPPRFKEIRPLMMDFYLMPASKLIYGKGGVLSHTSDKKPAEF